MFDRIIRNIHGVRHAPELKRNLISFSILDSFEYSFMLDNSGIRVTKRDSIVMKGKKRNGLHVLIGSSIPISAVIIAESNVDKTKL